ncbi:MAG: ferritin family protein [Syntrophales bacterium]|jgi:rubrerythrin|nr:ferritin family protein [Syntrophales bacterium]
MNDKKLEGIIDVAILREKESYDFYKFLSEKVKDAAAKETLEFLSEEEEKHRQFLSDYREGRTGEGSFTLPDVIDYRIAEHLEPPPLDKDMESKDVYLIAAHRELLSYNFYKALADLHPKGEVKGMLILIANQEKKHKEKVEYLYSNTAFPQTAGG